MDIKSNDQEKISIENIMNKIDKYIHKKILLKLKIMLKIYT